MSRCIANADGTNARALVKGNQAADYDAMLAGSTRSVQRYFATEARDKHRPREADVKEVHIAFSSSPSKCIKT